jgi:uncharacterized protein YjdB
MRNAGHSRLPLVLLALAPLLMHCQCGTDLPTNPGGDAGQLDPDAGLEPDGGVAENPVSLQMAPAAPTLAKETELALALTATYADGEVRDVTQQAEWSSADPSVATVSNEAGLRGRITALAAGNVTVSATFGGLSADAAVTVTDATLASLALDPTSLTLAAGTSAALRVVGTFSDGTQQDLTEQAQWTSSDTAVAEVSSTAGTRGQVTAVGPGSAVITAAVLGQTAQANVTVSLASLTSIGVEPASPTVAVGAAMQLTATGTFSDGSTQDLTAQATWQSADAAVATVQAGLVQGVGAGSTAITATVNNVTGSSTVTVTTATLQAVTVQPTSATIAIGMNLSFTAQGQYSDGTTQDLTATVNWTSSNPQTASISNAAGSKGVATGLAAGTVTLTATQGGVSGTATLTVTSATLSALEVNPGNASIPNGSQQQFTALGTFSDGSTSDLTTSVTWSSSNTQVATISNAAGSKGVASSVSVGQVTITATHSGVSGTAQLTVTPATVTALVVTPANASLPVGSTLQYTATAQLSDGTTQNVTQFATFASSNTAVATISNTFANKGLANAVSAGATTISATWNGLNGSTPLTVTSATLTSIVVSPPNPSLPAGYQLQFLATGHYSDGSTQDLTTQANWASSNTAVATISNAPGARGRATAVSVGSTTISATFGGINGSTLLTVTSATLSSVAIVPATATVNKGASTKLAAEGTFSDGSKANVTEQANWSSSQNSVATVSNLPGSKGTVTGGFVSGTATITATVAGKSGTAQVTVP